MYGENPNKYPPTSDGKKESHTWRHKMNAHHAARAGAARHNTLYATTGPQSCVMGAEIKAANGIDVAQARLNPVGAHTALVMNGFKW